MRERVFIALDYIIWYIIVMACLFLHWMRYTFVYFGVFGCCFLLVVFHMCTGWSVIGSGVRCLRYVREILERRRSAREQRRRDEREKMQHMIRNLRQIYREEMTDD